MNVMLVRRRPPRIAFSDASSVGCGSVIVVEGKVFQRNWSHLESSGSSTFRELEGYTFSRSFCVLLQSKSSLVYSTQSFFKPGTSGANAFSQDWAFANNWLCSPAYLTVRVVNHLKI